eukprot:CAMPEP_0172320546 /NCGR_PEP_ID=MMETSP1058-20130122/40768_1 /TAXON_ID=83371 /ORGANISM="Detonula confervacea, Strain CCMP 353" /LENGTH=149 /DNA_ID=CAMNT_0013035831 /DNA_START=76 /DNA_END=521 /DNA_ORIENTATION=-
MDPPTSSLSSHSKDNIYHHKTIPQHEIGQQQYKPSTPKTTNTSESHPSHSPSMAKSSIGKNSPRQPSNIRTECVNSRPKSPPIHRSRNAAKIIKGEIHNVLTVMRSDPRYYSTGEGNGMDEQRGRTNNQAGKRIQKSRFEYEERQQSVG